LDFLITNRKNDESNSKIALVFIDLDNFKYINDALGHQVGDAVLVEVGKRLRDAMCESDTVARFGGDEFAALIAQYESEASLAHCVRKIFDHLNGHILIEGHEVFVSASVGVAQYPQDASDCDGLLQLADIAMYRAKDSGREQISYYAPEMNQKIVERLKIETALRNAFENNQFWLAWQPQIDLKNERIIGVEVLMRCSAPEISGIGPDVFIPIAEENGLIALLGEWALKKAVADAQEHLLPVVDQGFRVAVNLSPVQLNKSTIDLVLPLAKALMEQSLILEIEMTESVLMKDRTHAIGYLRTMADFGIEFSVDDFGTGYSNLSRLADLPIHRLKIDQSFVQKMTDAGHRMNQMIQAIIDMGHALEIKVLAEGIETLEQKQALTDLGCDEAQGYFYAKPMKLEEFRALLAKQSTSSDESAP
jgi:diguanylate cyclase (GGDEF)-like protein